MNINVHDHVTAVESVPSSGVVKGALGVVIEVYPDGSLLVEFEPDTEQNLVVVEMDASQVMKVTRSAAQAA
jgi:hypothetical protein